MAIHPNGKAPYAPPKAVTDFIKIYREKDIRKPFDLQVLEQAGVSESLAPRTMQALKLLDIVDSDGNPTDQFEALVRAPEAQFKEGLADLFCAAYSDILSFADPADSDLSRLRDAFRPYQPRGQHERMITLMVGLLEFAGLDVSAAKASMKPKKEGPTTPRKPKADKPKRGRKPPEEKPDPSQHHTTNGHTPPSTDSVFGLSDRDLALLNDDELDEVWAALGHLAKAKVRARRQQESGGKTEPAREAGGGSQ